MGLIAPYAGGVEQRKKAHFTFCETAKFWIHSDMFIWAPFSWTQRMITSLSMEQSGTSVLLQGCHDLASNYGAQGDRF
jgi:hypothetical protein